MSVTFGCRTLQDREHILQLISDTVVPSSVLGFAFFGRQSAVCRGCNISCGISDTGWGEGFITVSKDQLVFVHG